MKKRLAIANLFFFYPVLIQILCYNKKQIDKRGGTLVKKILIIEDDTSISNELKDLLDHAGYSGIILRDFENSLEETKKENPDLILLDINIPKLNGEMLLQKIRKESNVPIIMVTSKNTEADEVLSMSYGADDYITKPYNPTILLLRINAIFNRMENKNDKLTYHDLEVIPKKGIIKKDEEEFLLTKNEMIIFTYLLANKGNIVTRDELMTDLWNNDSYINDNALNVNISRLRTKLKDFGYENAIETRKGQGYILN